MKMDSFVERDYSLEQMMPLIKECLRENKTVKFSPRGTSMLPMIRQGIDCVVLSAVPGKLNKFDLPLYQRANGQYVLHRIVKVGETYTCIGDNQFELEKGVRQDQLIAVMVGFTRAGKKYSADHVLYRLYCRFWHYSRPVRSFWLRGIGWLRRHLK